LTFSSFSIKYKNIFSSAVHKTVKTNNKRKNMRLISKKSHSKAINVQK